MMCHAELANPPSPPCLVPLATKPGEPGCRGRYLLRHDTPQAVIKNASSQFAAVSRCCLDVALRNFNFDFLAMLHIDVATTKNWFLKTRQRTTATSIFFVEFSVSHPKLTPATALPVSFPGLCKRLHSCAVGSRSLWPQTCRLNCWASGKS